MIKWLTAKKNKGFTTSSADNLITRRVRNLFNSKMLLRDLILIIEVPFNPFQVLREKFGHILEPCNVIGVDLHESLVGF